MRLTNFINVRGVQAVISNFGVAELLNKNPSNLANSISNYVAKDPGLMEGARPVYEKYYYIGKGGELMAAYYMNSIGFKKLTLSFREFSNTKTAARRGEIEEALRYYDGVIQAALKAEPEMAADLKLIPINKAAAL